MKFKIIQNVLLLDLRKHKKWQSQAFCWYYVKYRPLDTTCGTGPWSNIQSSMSSSSQTIAISGLNIIWKENLFCLLCPSNGDFLTISYCYGMFSTKQVVWIFFKAYLNTITFWPFPLLLMMTKPWDKIKFKLYQPLIYL